MTGAWTSDPCPEPALLCLLWGLSSPPSVAQSLQCPYVRGWSLQSLFCVRMEAAPAGHSGRRRGWAVLGAALLGGGVHPASCPGARLSPAVRGPGHAAGRESCPPPGAAVQTSPGRPRPPCARHALCLWFRGIAALEENCRLLSWVLRVTRLRRLGRPGSAAVPVGASGHGSVTRVPRVLWLPPSSPRGCPPAARHLRTLRGRKQKPRVSCRGVEVWGVGTLVGPPGMLALIRSGDAPTVSGAAVCAQRGGGPRPGVGAKEGSGQGQPL